MKKFITLIVLILSLGNTFAQNDNSSSKTMSDSLLINASYTPFCSYNECTTLQVDIISGNPPYSYQWSTNEVQSSITVCPKADTVISVIVKDKEGIQKKATINVKASQRPDVKITATDTIGCPILCTKLTASGAATYTWTFPGFTSSLQTVQVCMETPTVVRLTGSAQGCSDTLFYKVNVLPKVDIAIAGKKIICPGELITLTAEVFSPVKILKYEWQPVGAFSKSITITPLQTTTYTLTAVDSNYCAGLITATVEVVPCSGIEENTEAANALTIRPNPFTDITTVSFLSEQKNAQLRIMNILGKEVGHIYFSGKEVQIEKGDLEPGIYMIRVYAEHEIVRSKKLVVR